MPIPAGRGAAAPRGARAGSRARSGRAAPRWRSEAGSRRPPPRGRRDRGAGSREGEEAARAPDRRAALRTEGATRRAPRRARRPGGSTSAGIPPESAWRRAACSPSKRARSSPATRARARRAARYSVTSSALIGASRRTCASPAPKAARRRLARRPVDGEHEAERALEAPRQTGEAPGGGGAERAGVVDGEDEGRAAAGGRSAPATTRRSRSRPASAPREPRARPRRSARGRAPVTTWSTRSRHPGARRAHGGRGLPQPRRTVEQRGEGARAERGDELREGFLRRRTGHVGAPVRDAGEGAVDRLDRGHRPSLASRPSSAVGAFLPQTGGAHQMGRERPGQVSKIVAVRGLPLGHRGGRPSGVRRDFPTPPSALHPAIGRPHRAARGS